MRTHDYAERRIYFLTIYTAGKKSIFSVDRFANIAYEIVLSFSDNYKIILHCMCIVPDHIHLLVEPEGETSVDRFIGIVKGRISYLARRNGFDGEVWQRSFYDHVLRRAEDIAETVRYILENPERKGIVKNYSDYRWSCDRYGIKESAEGQR